MGQLRHEQWGDQGFIKHHHCIAHMAHSARTSINDTTNKQLPAIPGEAQR
jgi:hypothetical protein